MYTQWWVDDGWDKLEQAFVKVPNVKPGGINLSYNIWGDLFIDILYKKVM
jgi:hypothetical protein